VEQHKPDRRRDPERRAVVDIALSLAELDASWGDYRQALDYLDAADELSGGAVGPRWRFRRRRWQERGSGLKV
jgi:hypothetical protein